MLRGSSEMLASTILLRLSVGKIRNLNRYEARYYSQNGEDGIIAAILGKVGLTNKFCVEFGVDVKGKLKIVECNTAYLTKKKGWSFLWMDARQGTSEIKREFITAENINELFIEYKVPAIFDVLSIDIDYNTYWVWKAITGFNPRVVVVEYNASIPPTESLAAKYDPNSIWDETDYYGASLLAFAKLGSQKGYTLVACDNKGLNAFFVGNDLKDRFVSRNIGEVYKPPRYGEIVNGKYIGHPRSGKQFVAE